MYPLDDTIAAIASPPGGAARGVIRLSGPQAVECVAGIFQPDDGRSLASRAFPCAVTGMIRLPALHSPLPCDVYLWCRRPACIGAGETSAPRTDSIVRSYTGQPVAEIHTLGSPPLLQRVLRSLCEAGARLAGPGEFTLRAFLAGRIDLGQAEAVLGVIDAVDATQLRLALGQLAGGLARPLHRLRESLLELLAHLEAGFDFADEDLAFITPNQLEERLVEADAQLAAVARQMSSRSDTTSVPHVVLAGEPNSGKSSLWNVLVGERAALVSDRPGTTRDYLTAELDLGGVKCALIDTAGATVGGGDSCHRTLKREPDSLSAEVDLAAQVATAGQRQAADIEVLCFDFTRVPDARGACQRRSVAGRPQIVVLTKCDLAPTAVALDAIRTSSLTGEGIDTLRLRLRHQVLALRGGGVLAGTALRCGESLRLAGESLHRARDVATTGQDELVAGELRVALDELGKITGAVYTDDVLDRIFSRFCVGK